MKVISWNLGEGLRAAGAAAFDDALVDEDRGTAAAHFLADERPDIVALQGLVGWTVESLHDLAQLAELPHLRLFEAEGGELHQALLARTPLRHPMRLSEPLGEMGEWWQRRTLLHGAFAAEVRGLHVVTVHLSLASALLRRREAEFLAAKLPRQRGLVLGTLHAIRREERTHTLERCLPADATGCFPRREDVSAVELLLGAGYVDAGEASAQGNTVWPCPEHDEDLLLRLDYALHTPGLEVTSFAVRDTLELRTCSYHFPLVLHLDGST
ncbi:MAG: endonuclease/exonuclease/phosphatase family protein [Myxococcota bacterium]